MKKIITLSALCTIMFSGCNLGRSSDIACDSAPAKDAINNIAKNQNQSIVMLESFATVDDTKPNQTECKAIYRTNTMLQEDGLSYVVYQTQNAGEVIVEVK